MSYYKIRPRSGTASQWSSANPVLKEREIGYEIPDGGVGTGKVKLKMGDGVTNWNNLPYAQVIPDIVDNATTNDSTKVPSAKVAKNLQDQITTLNNSLSSEDYSSKITVSEEVTLQYAIKTGKKVEIQVYIPVGTTFPTGFKNVVNIPDLDATKPKYAVFSPNGYKDLNTPLGARIIETGVQIFGNNTTNQGSIVVYASCYVH